MAKEKLVEMPVRVLKKFLEAESELEDWLLSRDKKFIKKMERIRKDDKEGKFISWEEAKKLLDLE